MDINVKKNCAGLPDSHLHTMYSFDSELDPVCHAEDAIQLGLCAITLTDHVDLFTDDMVLDEGTPVTWSEENVLASVKAAAELRKSYPQLKVYAGIELGQATFLPEEADRVLSLADFDFVLGSMHNMRSGADYYYIDFTLPENDPYEIFDEYLDNIHDLVQWGKFDSLAHITYPLRYIVGRDRIDLDQSKFSGKIDLILKKLADSGKALEINTSGVRRENGSLLPDIDIVRRFRKFGGRYITLGSDAHRVGHIGAGIGEGAKMAKEAGFDSVVVYEHHKPIEIRI